MRETLVGERTENISPQIPPGLIKFGERWVESKPITYPNHITSCFIRGKLDAVISFDNGSYGIVDFKTSKPTDKHANTYFRQLNSYAYCVLNAAKGKFALNSVTKLGLLVYEPTSFKNDSHGNAALDGALTWIDVPLNPDLFLGYLDNVLKVLENVEPPEASPKCPWCKYREGALNDSSE